LAGVGRGSAIGTWRSAGRAPALRRGGLGHFCSGYLEPEGRGDRFNTDALKARHNIRPRNLTETAYFAEKSDEELYATIALGGGHRGKSLFMPDRRSRAW